MYSKRDKIQPFSISVSRVTVIFSSVDERKMKLLVYSASLEQEERNLQQIYWKMLFMVERAKPSEIRDTSLPFQGCWSWSCKQAEFGMFAWDLPNCPFFAALTMPYARHWPIWSLISQIILFYTVIASRQSFIILRFRLSSSPFRRQFPIAYHQPDLRFPLFSPSQNGAARSTALFQPLSTTSSVRPPSPLLLNRFCSLGRLGNRPRD